MSLYVPIFPHWTFCHYFRFPHFFPFFFSFLCFLLSTPCPTYSFFVSSLYLFVSFFFSLFSFFICNPLSPTQPNIFSLHAAALAIVVATPSHCWPTVVMYSLATTHCHCHSHCGWSWPPLRPTATTILFPLFFVVQVSLECKSLFLAYGFALIWFFFNGSWRFCANFCYFSILVGKFLLFKFLYSVSICFWLMGLLWFCFSLMGHGVLC